MACYRVRLPEGGFALVRITGKRVNCCVKCGCIATRECDWKVKGKRSGTCDAHLCDVCTVEPEQGKDLCPEHAKAWEQWKLRHAAAQPSEHAS